jgi:hypothetical protein
MSGLIVRFASKRPSSDPVWQAGFPTCCKRGENSRQPFALTLGAPGGRTLTSLRENASPAPRPRGLSKEGSMSEYDQLFCRRIAQLTLRKKLSNNSKIRIRTLVRTTGFTFYWKPAKKILIGNVN